MKKIIIKIFFLILIINSCFALTVREHEINISIDKKGIPTITEKYYLNFAYSFDENRFLEKAKQNSSSLSAWRSEYPDWFYTQLTKDDSQIHKSTIQMDEKKDLLTLTYELNEPIATIIESQPREEKWKINENIFQSFIETGLIKIPENTKIIFELPFGAKIETSKIKEFATINANKIILTGITTNSIPLIYTIQKSISPDVNSNLIEEIISNKTLLTSIILILILLTGVGYIKRKTIEKKIEKYIVEHSEIEARDAEEFELDLSK